jgi:hypothetical protein
VKVTLIINENDDGVIGNGVIQRFEAQQRGGKFALGLVFQVAQAAAASRQHELAMAKALLDAIAPAIDVLRRAFFTGKVEAETSEHRDNEKVREGAAR